MINKLKLMLLCILCCLISNQSFAVDASKIAEIKKKLAELKPQNKQGYVDYTNYLLTALAQAKQISPALIIPKADEIGLALTLLSYAYGAHDATKNTNVENIVKSAFEKYSDVGLTALKSGSAIIGYAIMDSNPYLTWVFSSGPTAASYIAPKILDYFSAPLPKLNEKYDIAQFEDPKVMQETYLSCSYNDPKNANNNFKTWAYEKYLDNDLKKRLKFYKDTVLLSGRWIAHTIKNAQTYVFGTLLNFALAQAACIEAIAGYAKENSIKIDDAKYIGFSAGNTSMSNSYPIRFFVPVDTKDPNTDVVKREALLLGG